MHTHSLLFSVIRSKAEEHTNPLARRVSLGRCTHQPHLKDSGVESLEGISRAQLGGC